MDYESRLAISYYREIAAINQEHHIYLVQHIETHKFYVKKILNIFHKEIYLQLKAHPVKGIPFICELYEEDEKLTVIEEYISGKTVDEYLAEHGPLTPAPAATYILQLCDILSQLHRLTPAIIHRDIKPSNVMITSLGHVVLLDLNTAKYADRTKSADTVLLGTQGYAAPEQYGFGSSCIQTDIYGTGILLNYMLTGELPNKQLSSGPFTSIIKKSTELLPENRFQSIEEFKQAVMLLKQKGFPEKASAKTSDISLLPPGYRSKNLFHMTVATLAYFFLLYFGLTLNVENASPSVLMIERIFFIGIFLLMILFSGNYLNIQKSFPFCNSKYLPIRILAIMVYDFLIFCTMMILMSITETFFV